MVSGGQKYHNPWIPAGALDLLDGESGSILDVGGGAAPYWKSSHVIDIQPYDPERLRDNAWGRGAQTADCRLQTADVGMEDRGRRTEVGLQTTDGDRGQKTEIGEEPGTKNQEPAERFWKPEDYTQYDLCSGEKWPFADKVFDLGLSSHCLEDIRDPVQVVKEMGRVCKRVLIVCPSRLLEQMRGVDHPRYCGMPHHLWMVSEADGVLEFRRKTQIIEFPGMHLSCPPGKIPTTEAGSMYYLSVAPVAREVMYFDTQEDKRDYAAFVAEHADVKCVLEADARWRDWRRWVWYFRQMWFYAV